MISDRRGFMVSICVEISWTCLGGWKDVLFVALLTCRCCSLISFWCRNLYGLNAVLLCNGKFWEWGGFTSATSASFCPWLVVTTRRPTAWLLAFLSFQFMHYHLDMRLLRGNHNMFCVFTIFLQQQQQQQKRYISASNNW